MAISINIFFSKKSTFNLFFLSSNEITLEKSMNF